MTASDPTGLDVDVDLELGALKLSAALSVGRVPLALIGPNGSGKTSLLLAILGILLPRRGRVVLGGDVLFDGAAGVCKPAEERRLAYVPQNYGLFPHLTAVDNVAFALACTPPRLRRTERIQRARAVLESLGASAFADRRPDQLSGGEKQRVALARAMATSPRALLFDEPVAALDVEGRDEIRSFLVGHVRRTALPTIVITHDVADVRALGATVAVMERGRVVGAGSLAAVTANPPSAYAARFTAGAVV
ncbi:MAG TPA: ATP-binding cassette domain-containing protein [Polyangia bacterium]|jgi:ABC-type sulfate/molybdate transport systems ATPase subunit|nr:ATP-binding cassette domain-containing protein [Polyangia bacterium]